MNASVNIGEITIKAIKSAFPKYQVEGKSSRYNVDGALGFRICSIVWDKQEYHWYYEPCDNDMTERMLEELGKKGIIAEEVIGAKHYKLSLLAQPKKKIKMREMEF
jgi:hypothetical protein